MNEDRPKGILSVIRVTSFVNTRVAFQKISQVHLLDIKLEKFHNYNFNEFVKIKLISIFPPISIISSKRIIPG